MSVITRLAGPDDAAAIARIYNQGIEDRVATFETEPRSPEDIRAQLASKGDRYPTVVVERDGVVVAWASAGAYRGRPAYAGVAEHSVYVDRSARGHGAGRAALDALFRCYEARGFWKLVSRIFPENVASLRVAEKSGAIREGIANQRLRLQGRSQDAVVFALLRPVVL